MRQGLIITAVGRDHPGIVDQISGVVFREGCNLEDSRMSILGGHFALILLATGPTAAIESVSGSFPMFAEEADLSVRVQPTAVDEDEGASEALLYRITAVSMDHPGIVHKISNLLAQQGINVASMETRVSHAPTTGTPVFSLSIDAQVPAKIPVAEIRDLLGRVADDENLDLDIRAVT